MMPFAFFIAVALLGVSEEETTTSEASWTDTVIASMTLDQKVGQLLFPTVEPSELEADEEKWNAFALQVGRFQPGGIHVFRSPAKTAATLANRLQETSPQPLLLTADLEGGAGWIFTGTTRLPRGMGLAATGEPRWAREAAQVTAAEGRAVGVHVNFFPVMDVNINALNPIINIRAFGESPLDVIRFGTAYVESLQRSGMIATAKHFPGHGDTETDSHLELPIVDAERSRLDSIELPPFRAAVDAGVGAVMSAHIAWPRVSKNPSRPATLDPDVIDAILRREMRFEGIVFTDALTMNGIRNHYTMEEASVLAIEAGADVLLFADMTVSHRALVKAVREGRLAEARIDRSVRRILEAKERLGLHRSRVVDVEGLDAKLRTKEANRVAESIVRRSFTRTRNDRGILPLYAAEAKSILNVRIADDGDWFDFTPGVELERALDGRVRRLETMTIGPDGRELAEALVRAREFDHILVSVYLRTNAFRGELGLTEAQAASIEAFGRAGAILLGIGNPYVFAGIDTFDTVLLAYDAEPTTDRLAAGALLGDFPLVGRLPVTIPGFARRGAGGDQE